MTSRPSLTRLQGLFPGFAAGFSNGVPKSPELKSLDELDELEEEDELCASATAGLIRETAASPARTAEDVERRGRGELWERPGRRKRGVRGVCTVSYTHLTLPTILLV